MKLRKSRQHRRGRIEIIPMIDVMFFLLVTFMLASLSMQNLHSWRSTSPREARCAHAAQDPGDAYRDQGQPHLSGQDPGDSRDPCRDLEADAQGAGSSVIVAADSAAPNGITVQAMIQSRDGGAQHFRRA